MNKSLKDFDAVLRSNPRNALALARGLTLLKKRDRIAGNTEISAAKAINHFLISNVKEVLSGFENAYSYKAISCGCPMICTKP